MDTIAIDTTGMVFLCCAKPYYKLLEIGLYLSMTKSELLLKRLNHKMCIKCNWKRRKLTENDCSTLLSAYNDSYICLANELELLKQEYKKNELLIEEMLSSKSWRITAPLRNIFNWFRNV